MGQFVVYEQVCTSIFILSVTVSLWFLFWKYFIFSFTEYHSVYKLQCYWYSVASQTWYQVYWLVLILGTVM